MRGVNKAEGLLFIPSRSGPSDIPIVPNYHFNGLGVGVQPAREFDFRNRKYSVFTKSPVSAVPLLVVPRLTPSQNSGNQYDVALVPERYR